MQHHLYTHHQYIHCAGNCFVLIPTQVELMPGIQWIKGMSIKKKSDASSMAIKTPTGTSQMNVNNTCAKL